MANSTAFSARTGDSAARSTATAVSVSRAAISVGSISIAVLNSPNSMTTVAGSCWKKLKRSRRRRYSTAPGGTNTSAPLTKATPVVTAAESRLLSP
jgi:hypothetical protein